MVQILSFIILLLPFITGSDKSHSQMFVQPFSQAAVLGEQDSSPPSIKGAAITDLQLEKHDFSANENVTATFNNPDDVSSHVTVLDHSGKNVPVSFERKTYANRTQIVLNASEIMHPGVFSLVIDDGNGSLLRDEFSWGLQILNTDREIYSSGQTADVQIEVLNDQGENNCEADVSLTIIRPNGEADILSIENKKIIPQLDCRAKHGKNTADFTAKYHLFDDGVYHIILHTTSQSKIAEVTKDILVEKQNAFDIQRDTKTRYYAGEDAENTMTVTANRDFDGYVTDVVPDSFIIKNAEGQTYDSVQSITIDKSDESQTQLTGLTLDSLNKHLQLPFHGVFAISQGYGTTQTDDSLKNFYQHFGLLGHDGIDFALPNNTPLYAVDEGEVIYAGAGGYGNMVIIQHAWGKSYYGHLSTVSATVGMHLFAGAEIGFSGDTGESTGPHLHFGIVPNNPDMHNGYAGMIDPMPYLPVMHTEQNKDALTMATPRMVLGLAMIAQMSSMPPQASDAAGVDQLEVLQNSSSQIASDSSVFSSLPSMVASVAAKPVVSMSDQIVKNIQVNHFYTPGQIKLITWKVHLQKGDAKVLSYRYSTQSEGEALFGPVNIFEKDSLENIYSQNQMWQIAQVTPPTHWKSTFLYRKKLHIDHTQIKTAGFDSASKPEHGIDVSSISWKQTIHEGTNRLLIVGLGSHHGVARTVTYGESSLQRLAEDTCDKNTCRSELWYLVDPPVGSGTVNITLDGKETFVAGSASFYGINQSQPFARFRTKQGYGKTSASSLIADPNQIVLSLSTDADAHVIVPPNTMALWQEQNGIGFQGGYMSGSDGALSWSHPREDSVWVDIDAILNPADMPLYPYFMSWDSDVRFAQSASGETNTFAFTTSDENNITHEKNGYTATSGGLSAWILVPLLSTTKDSDIYFYYDAKGSASNQ